LERKRCFLTLLPLSFPLFSNELNDPFLWQGWSSFLVFMWTGLLALPRKGEDALFAFSGRKLSGLFSPTPAIPYPLKPAFD